MGAMAAFKAVDRVKYNCNNCKESQNCAAHAKDKIAGRVRHQARRGGGSRGEGGHGHRSKRRRRAGRFEGEKQGAEGRRSERAAAAVDATVDLTIRPAEVVAAASAVTVKIEPGVALVEPVAAIKPQHPHSLLALGCSQRAITALTNCPILVKSAH
jgi:hypothetical protein